MDIVWLDEMQLQLQLQLQWLRQPASLIQLLQRPVWLDAWVHGEEERASFLWRQPRDPPHPEATHHRGVDDQVRLRPEAKAQEARHQQVEVEDTLLLRALPPEDAYRARPARLAGLSRYEMFDAHAPAHAYA